MRQIFAAAVGGALTFVAVAANATESAIGRLNYAGYRQQMHCSATLIAPNLALTAAHCVNNKDVTTMHVLPGYDRGEWPEELHPSGVAKAPPPRDLAVLCLQQPARSAFLPLSKVAVRVGERLTVIGYPIPGMHMQTQASCAVDQVGAMKSFRLTCPMKPGASGAPVLRETPAGFEVVGVISSTNATQSLAYGVEDNLARSCQ